MKKIRKGYDLRFYWKCNSENCPQKTFSQSLSNYFYTHKNGHSGFPRQASGPTLVQVPIKSNLQLHLDATNIDGLDNSSFTNGQAVSTWQDISGLVNNATQNTTSMRPTYEKDGFGPDKPAINFIHSYSQHFNLPNGTIPYNNDNYTISLYKG